MAIHDLMVNDDISLSETLSSNFYTKSEFFESSKEQIFSTSWQLITNSQSLKNKIYPFTFLDGYINEPLLLTKSEGKINCISNVCTHRAHIVCEKNCDGSILHCRYHGRTFELNGRMKAMPGFEGVKNFPSEKDHLASISTVIWKDFIFVSLRPQIDIMSVLDDIQFRLQGYEFNKLVFNEMRSKEYIINAHWAIYCENYLEGFHIPLVHKGLTKEIITDKYKTICLENGVLQTAVCNDGDDMILLSDSTPDSDQKIYAYYYWIFPNLMLNFYAWGLSINIIEPLCKDKTRIKYQTYILPHKKQPTTNDADVYKVEHEDQEVVQSVQRGIGSQYYKTGRYSAKHETGVHHFHRLLVKHLV